MKRLCCIFLFFITGCLFTFGQHYPFIIFTPRDGLINANVRKVGQDTKGRMYFLTVNGFSIYDGSRFINFTTDDGLPEAIVNDICEITPDSILIATNTNKLTAQVRGLIKPVEINGFTPVINKFFKAQNKHLYVVADEGLFQLKEKSFIPVPLLDENNNPIIHLDDLFEIGDCFLISRYDPLSRYNDLFLLNKSTGKIKASLYKISTSGFLSISEENIFFIVADNLVRCFDLQHMKEGRIKEIGLPAKYRYLKNIRLMSIVQDKNKNTWIIMPSSIMRMDTSGNQQLFKKNARPEIHNLGQVFVDRENTLWMTSQGIGVVKLANNNLEIMNGSIGGNNFVATGFYTSTGTDTVWIFNRFENCLYRYTPKKIRKWKIKKDVRVSNIFTQKESLIICGAHAIYKIDNINSIKSFTLKKIYQNNNNNNLSKAIIDTYGNIYIPGNNITIVSKNGDTSVMELPGFSDQVCLDAHNRLWTITRANNVFSYRISNKNKQPSLILDQDYSKKFSVIQPRSIAIDKEGKIWIGTRNDGIHCFKLNNTTVIEKVNLSKKDGLTDNFINDIAFDKSNNIWAASFIGLDKIYTSKSRYRIANITASNNMYMHVLRVQVDKHNNIWFSGMRNIMRIPAWDSTTTEYTPQLQISRILNNNKNLGIPSDGLILPHTTSTLRFEFAVPSSQFEKQIHYSYRLKGTGENEWSPPSKESDFNFVNLKPGRYNLEVRAFFPSSSELKTQELAYLFTILPGWWQTTWFKLTMSILILAVSFSLLRLYYERKISIQKSILEKHKAVELERTRISREIHDDLGAGLTSIRYLAVGLNGESSAGKKEKLSKIVTSANELIENMNDIIWTMKSDNNLAMETLSYIRKHAAEQLEYAGIKYEFRFLEDILNELSNEQKRNLLLISKESIHNIIKHARATMVQVCATTRNNLFCLSIADNGIGFADNKNINTGNGIRNMKARASEMGGTLKVIHKKGTIIKLTFEMPAILNNELSKVQN